MNETHFDHPELTISFRKLLLGTPIIRVWDGGRVVSPLLPSRSLRESFSAKARAVEPHASRLNGIALYAEKPLPGRPSGR